MTNPASFETSWKEAERSAYDRLVAACGSAEGRDAFLGKNPGIINAWHFEGRKIDRAGLDALLAPDLHSLCIPYRAECVFLKRDRCMEWAMRVFGALPVMQDAESNVAAFRVTSVSEIAATSITIANEKSPVDVWTLELLFDLAFTTGGKANLATALPG